jgi:hypothetical protein
VVVQQHLLRLLPRCSESDVWHCVENICKPFHVFFLQDFRLFFFPLGEVKNHILVYISSVRIIHYSPKLQKYYKVRNSAQTSHENSYIHVAKHFLALVILRVGGHSIVAQEKLLQILLCFFQSQSLLFFFLFYSLRLVAIKSLLLFVKFCKCCISWVVLDYTETLIPRGIT